MSENAVMTAKEDGVSEKGVPEKGVVNSKLSHREQGDWQLRVNEEFDTELSTELFLSWCNELWQLAMHQDAKVLPEDVVTIGRGVVLNKELPSGRRVVLRLCRRGGMVRFLTRYTFGNNPLTSWEFARPFDELSLLADLRAVGLSVPRPVAAAVIRGTGDLFYRGFVATEEVPVAENLLHVIQELRGTPGSTALARTLCEKAGRQAATMLEMGVFHSDLHVGNILVTKDDDIFLIDFDKSSRFTPSKKDHYRDRLVARWRKSVRKHRVRYPDVLLAGEQGFLQGLLDPR